MGLYITALKWHIDKFIEWKHCHSDLLFEPLQKLLRIVRPIKRVPLRVVPGTRMVSPDDKIIGAVVSSNDGAPDGLPRPSHAHGKRQQAEDCARVVIVPFK